MILNSRWFTAHLYGIHDIFELQSLHDQVLRAILRHLMLLTIDYLRICHLTYKPFIVIFSLGTVRTYLQSSSQWTTWTYLEGLHWGLTLLG